MFGLGLIPIAEGPVHLFIALAFDFLILTMFVWMLASWFVAMMPQAGGGRFLRFLETIIAPFTEPIRKRIPQSSVGMFSIGGTIAFVFAWWALRVLAIVIIIALPNGW
jgi:uncharacterized protein YggT (Ycf19 family)